MAMEPEARIAPPEGNGEPLENMSGGRDRVHGAGSVGNCPAQGADGKDNNFVWANFRTTTAVRNLNVRSVIFA